MVNESIYILNTYIYITSLYKSILIKDRKKSNTRKTV
jgi:hypothetical protein